MPVVLLVDGGGRRGRCLCVLVADPNRSPYEHRLFGSKRGMSLVPCRESVPNKGLKTSLSRAVEEGGAGGGGQSRSVVAVKSAVDLSCSDPGKGSRPGLVIYSLRARSVKSAACTHALLVE